MSAIGRRLYAANVGRLDFVDDDHDVRVLIQQAGSCC